MYYTDGSGYDVIFQEGFISGVGMLCILSLELRVSMGFPVGH